MILAGLVEELLAESVAASLPPLPQLHECDSALNVLAQNLVAAAPARTRIAVVCMLVDCASLSALGSHRVREALRCCVRAQLGGVHISAGSLAEYGVRNVVDE